LQSNKINICKLYVLSQTKEFVEWYYNPENIGGKVAKRRMVEFTKKL